MTLKKYNQFLNEALDLEEIKNGFDEQFVELKKDLLDLIDETLKESKGEDYNMIDIENFVNDYISSGKESKTIYGLIEDNDVFNFYLKNQSDVDELLTDDLYMEQPPKDNNVFSLYDIVIDGTKVAILKALEIIKKEIK